MATVDTTNFTLQRVGAATVIPAQVYGTVNSSFVTLKPFDALVIGTTYQANVATAVTDVAGNNLPSVFTSNFDTQSGTSDFADDDGDLLTNGEETVFGLLSASRDSDGDGLSDFAELFVYGTDPQVGDTDGDGLLDGEEIAVRADPLTEEDRGAGFPHYVIFVSTTGDDTTGTGREDKPYRTVQRGVDNALAGSVVLVERGSYNLTAAITVPATGLENLPIRIQAQNRDINGAGVTLNSTSIGTAFNLT